LAVEPNISRVPDLRFGAAPLPEAFAGYDPAGDAAALIAPGTPSPAPAPIPGREVRMLGPGARRAFVRIPDAWNGRLAALGTPATRSEHANDAIFGDALLAEGYAYACSNKGIPYNAYVEPGPAPDARAYDIPFAMGTVPAGTATMRFGALDPACPGLAAWHEDFASLIREAKNVLRDAAGRPPAFTYALGLSMGGGQVRYVLERHAELVDGGLEWAAVHWNAEHAFLRYLPAFLARMPAYVASGYADRAAHDAIVAAGFPPDRRQPGPLASLWDAHYGAVPPFYNDLTTFLFAGVLDRAAPPPATLAARAAYVPGPAVLREIATVAQTGAIEKPLVGFAGDADVFITPQHNFDPYVAAVRAAGRGDRYWPFEIAGGTHVDGFAAFGWGLQPQLPFVRRGFRLLTGIVERGERPAGAGTKRRVHTPDDV
jgi:hypothetical protein